MRTVVVLAEAEDMSKLEIFMMHKNLALAITAPTHWVADIKRLALYHGIHSRHFDFTGCWPIGSRSVFITAKLKLKLKCLPC